MAYVQAMRIEEAKQILETTDMPIDDVGHEVGYIEPASFRRTVSPVGRGHASAYRRRFQPLFKMTSNSAAA